MKNILSQRDIPSPTKIIILRECKVILLVQSQILYKYNYNSNKTQYAYLNHMGELQQSHFSNQLKQKVPLSASQLYQIASDHQKFMFVMKKLNNQAKYQIDSQTPERGLNYLAEAERVLEYAASCGKNIDRNLIICILHNEACCFQRMWDLEKCSNYIQAIIYNFHQNLGSWETTPVSKHNSTFKNDDNSVDLMAGLEKKSWNFRLELVGYELQFCAINSQLRNHKTALQSGLKSIKILKSILLEMTEVHLKTQQSHPPSEQDNTLIRNKTLTGIATFSDEIRVDQFDQLVLSARYYLGKWNIRKLETHNEEIKESLKNFSIGNIMQLKPKIFDDNKSMEVNIKKEVQCCQTSKSKADEFKKQTYQSILNKVLLLSMSYFTVATELRLLAAEKYNKNAENMRETSQFKQSQIYHLIALIIPCIYVPYDMIYLRHILSSINTHSNVMIDSALSLSKEHQNIVFKNQFDSQGLAQCKDYFVKIESEVFYGKINKHSKKPSKTKKQKSSNRSSKSKKKSRSEKNSKLNSLKHSRSKQKSLSKQKGLKTEKTPHKQKLKLKSVSTRLKQPVGTNQYYRGAAVKSPQVRQGSKNKKVKYKGLVDDKNEEKVEKNKRNYKKKIDSYYF